LKKSQKPILMQLK